MAKAIGLNVVKASALRRWLVFIRLLAFVHTTRLTGGNGSSLTIGDISPIMDSEMHRREAYADDQPLLRHHHRDVPAQQGTQPAAHPRDHAGLRRALPDRHG